MSIETLRRLVTGLVRDAPFTRTIAIDHPFYITFVRPRIKAHARVSNSQGVRKRRRVRIAFVRGRRLFNQSRRTRALKRDYVRSGRRGTSFQTALLKSKPGPDSPFECSIVTTTVNSVHGRCARTFRRRGSVYFGRFPLYGTHLVRQPKLFKCTRVFATKIRIHRHA